MEPNLTVKVVGVGDVQDSLGSIDGKEGFVSHIGIVVHVHGSGNSVSQPDNGGDLTFVGGVHHLSKIRAIIMSIQITNSATIIS